MRQWPEDDDTLRRIFDTSRTWAVVGCSPILHATATASPAYVRSLGYRVIPIRPDCDEVLGERCYPTLASIPADIPVDVVDVFRRSAAAGGHVDEAIAIGARRCGSSSA